MSSYGMLAQLLHNNLSTASRSSQIILNVSVLGIRNFQREFEEKSTEERGVVDLLH